MADVSLPVETDLYAVLGVPQKATESQISKQFHKLAKACHPDLHPNDKRAEKEFKRISAAYEVLGDAKQRDRYDTERRLLARRAAEGSAPTPSAYTPAPSTGTAPTNGGAMAETAAWINATESKIQLLLRRMFFARLWVGGAMCLIGAVLILGYAYSLFTGLTSSRPTATATIVVDQPNKVRGANALEFTTNAGTQVRATVPKSLRTLAVGSQVNVRYDPAHPTSATSADDPLFGGINIWGIVGLGIFGLGFLTLPFHKYRIVRIKG